MIPSGDKGIRIEEVSKFYGDVLGVNRVDLTIGPGITGLVGPNGSGKSTLMNLVAGLIRPSRGRIRVLGIGPDDPEKLFRNIGYCAQYDSFPIGLTGRKFLTNSLSLYGFSKKDCAALTDQALQRVGMSAAADRRIAGYSKGMRQRIKLAQAICHEPRLMILDEPLNGLDPMVRAEIIELLQTLSAAGGHVLISSHILHEVDLISDRVVVLRYGYVVAEGEVESVHGELTEHPVQVLIRCKEAHIVAARLFEIHNVMQARLHEAGDGLTVYTKDADAFYTAFNQLVLDHGWQVDSIRQADETIEAVYQHLVVDELTA